MPRCHEPSTGSKRYCYRANGGDNGAFQQGLDSVRPKDGRGERQEESPRSCWPSSPGGWSLQGRTQVPYRQPMAQRRRPGNDHGCPWRHRRDRDFVHCTVHAGRSTAPLTNKALDQKLAIQAANDALSAFQTHLAEDPRFPYKYCSNGCANDSLSVSTTQGN